MTSLVSIVTGEILFVAKYLVVIDEGFDFKTTDDDRPRLTAQGASNAYNLRSRHAQTAVCSSEVPGDDVKWRRIKVGSMP